MLFNSISFMIFFPIVVTLYYLLPHRWRWLMLLTASCIFYMAFIPAYILILFVTIIIDYFAGIYIEKSEGKKKKILLIVSILSTVLVLFIFKYFNFFNANVTAIAKFFHWNYPLSLINIILPIGLSFHTFQSLSYVVEVYYGRQKAEKNFGIYSLYVMFFPQLVAGPIERPGNLLHQLYQKHQFDMKNLLDGLKLMLWGFFKKIVIADRLAEFVNPVFNNPHDYNGLYFIVASIFFAFQIYCDFSGYSDIALGSARVMGFKLMLNFNRPYFSKSINEFWKRWHISLSSWFRDYVYIPLGGNRVKTHRWFFNLFIVFLLSGIWHGANWTFIIWGALHGFYLIFSILTTPARIRIREFLHIQNNIFFNKYFKIVMTFIFVTFAWIFFRAVNVSDAFYIVTNLFNFNLNDIKEFITLKSLDSFGFSKYNFILSIAVILFMEFIHFYQRKNSVRTFISKKPLVIQWSIFYFVLFSIFMLGAFNAQEFIYFQF